MIVSDVDPTGGGDRRRRAIHLRLRCPRGNTRVKPSETNFDGDRKIQWTHRPLPEVFAPTKLTIKEGETPAPLEIRASPSVVIEGQWVDSKGQPKGGWSSCVFGRIDGSFWNAQAHPDAQGRFSLKVPHGLEDVQLDIIDQRARLDAAPDRQGRAAGRGPYGQARHARPRRQGDRDRPVRGADHRHQRHDEGRPADQGLQGGRRSTPSPARIAARTSTSWAAGRRRRPSRTSSTTGATGRRSMLPDREVNVTVSADGFEEASRKLTLPEGKTEEVTFVLEPKCTQGSGPMRARRRGSGRAPGDARGPAVVGRTGSSRCACRTGRRCRRVEFDRHVASLFGRLGCNAGSCHGSFQGRGGLNLSLFGHDPARDFQAIARGASGRRVNVARPRPQPGPAEGHRPGAARGGPAVRPRVVGVPGHPRLDRRRRPPRPGPAGAAGDRDPARRVAARTSGRDRPARGRRPVRRRLRGRRHPVLRPPRPGRRGRRRLDRGPSGASGPATPRWSPPTTAWSRRPASSSRPAGPSRSPRSPPPTSSTARCTPSSAPSASSPRARRPTPSSSAGSRST